MFRETHFQNQFIDHLMHLFCDVILLHSIPRDALFEYFQKIICTLQKGYNLQKNSLISGWTNFYPNYKPPSNKQTDKILLVAAICTFVEEYRGREGFEHFEFTPEQVARLICTRWHMILLTEIIDPKLGLSVEVLQRLSDAPSLSSGSGESDEMKRLKTIIRTVGSLSKRSRKRKVSGDSPTMDKLTISPSEKRPKRSEVSLLTSQLLSGADLTRSKELSQYAKEFVPEIFSADQSSDAESQTTELVDFDHLSELPEIFGYQEITVSQLYNSFSKEIALLDLVDDGLDDYFELDPSLSCLR